MGYKETDGIADDTESTGELQTDIGDLDFPEELEFTEGDELPSAEAKTAAKTQPGNRFSLKARRAIEEHLEHRRLRKQLDYLFDDGFAAKGEDEETK
jgi:hypothetical protein